MVSLEEKKRQIKNIEMGFKKIFPQVLKEIEHYEQVLQEKMAKEERST